MTNVAGVGVGLCFGVGLGVGFALGACVCLGDALDVVGSACSEGAPQAESTASKVKAASGRAIFMR